MEPPSNDHSVNDPECILSRAAYLQQEIAEVKKSVIEAAKETQELKKETDELRAKIEAFAEKVARRESSEDSESTSSGQYDSEGDGYTDSDDDDEDDDKKSVAEGEGVRGKMGGEESDSSLIRGLQSCVSPPRDEDQGLEEMGEDASEHEEPHNINATVTWTEK